MNKLLVVALVLSMLMGMTGCVEKKPVESSMPYEEYLVLGMTEEQYLSEIYNDLQTIYAPKTHISVDELKTILQRHMTEECAEKFATPNTKSNIKESTLKCYVKNLMFGYGEHQRDGVPRVIAALRVESDTRYWEINLEMRLNSDGFIYDIEVY